MSRSSLPFIPEFLANDVVRLKADASAATPPITRIGVMFWFV